MKPWVAVGKTCCWLTTQAQLYRCLRHAGRTTSILGGLASIVLASTTVVAQSTSAAKISFSKAGGNIEITIPSGTILRTVITDLCEKTKSHCEGTENVPSEQMPAMSMRGSWEHVLEQLLAGSGVNYAVVSAMPNSAGSVVILPPSQSTDPPQEASASRPSPPDRQSSLASPISTLPRTESAESNMDEVETTTDEEASNPSTMGYLPFPDSHGRPVPANPQASGGMPFSTGDTAATDSDAPQYLPFPDSHGNPVPAKPGPPGLPFSTKPN